MSASPARNTFIAILIIIVFAAVAAWWWVGRDWMDMTTEDVRIASGEVTLAATVVRPRADGVVPGVVIIHGSGPVERSGVMWYARMFARRGYAALVYDKRGVGESTGAAEAWRYFRFDDLASDAGAAVTFLRSLPDVDPDRVGVFAASQGGWVAPLVARDTEGVAFMVLMSASVCSVAQDRLFERSARLEHEGFDPEDISEVYEMQLVDQEVTRSGKRYEEFVELWNRNYGKHWFQRVYLSEDPIAPDDPYRRWYAEVLDYDPTPVLAALSVPTLWIFGDPVLDRFGPVDQSLLAVEALKRRDKDYTIRVYDGADHSLQKPGRGWRAWVERKELFEDDLFAWLGGR